MKNVRLRCRVIEVSRDSEDRLHILDRTKEQPRDLLPWADPYIARLMHILEDRYETGRGRQEWENDFDLELLEAPQPLEEAWRYDAFVPRPFERGAFAGNVFGGFPLLDDADSSDDTLAL